MSWSISEKGPKSEVRLAVQNSRYMQDSIRNAIIEIIDESESSPTDSVKVEGCGHFGGGCGAGIASLRVEKFNAEKAPVVETAPATVDESPAASASDEAPAPEAAPPQG